MIQPQHVHTFAMPLRAKASAPQFAGQTPTTQADQQTDPPAHATRSRLHKVLLGIGVMIGLTVGGRIALKSVSKDVLLELQAKVGQRLSEHQSSPAGKALVSSLSTGGHWLLEALRSDVGAELLASGCKFVGATFPAISGVTNQITKETIQNVLQPEAIQSLLQQISTHQLYSIDAVKNHLSRNIDSVAEHLSSLTGFDRQGIQDTIQSLLSAFRSPAGTAAA